MKRTVLRLIVPAMVAVGFLNLPAAAQDAGEMTAWTSIQSSESADQLKSFLNSYPTGKYASEARQKYSLIANTMLPPQVQDIDVTFPLDARRVGRSVGPKRVVKLNIVVQRDGTAGDVEIAKSSGFTPYDRAALQAAKRAVYLPAVDHGMPLEARMDYDVSFGLLCNRAAGGGPDCDAGRFPQVCSATVCDTLFR